MRILYLDYTNNIGIGGGQRSLALLLRHLPRPEIEPLLACPPQEQLLAHVPGDIPVPPLSLPLSLRTLSRHGSIPRFLAALLALWPAARCLRAIAVANSVDMIHANNMKMLLLAACAAPHLPRIWHVRDIYPRRLLARAVVRLAYLLANSVLCVSRAVASQFPCGPKLQVLYNAVEISPAVPAIQTPGRELTIGYAGRLDHGKGLDTLVEAFRLLGGVNVKLLIAGDGPLAESLAGHPFVERIPFQHDLSQVWNRFDIVVQPSTEPDAFPRSVIEAMSHARPVVGSRTGGIPEAIEDGVTGFTFQPGDAPALADRLRVLIADATLRAAMGEAARKRCESMFTVERQIRRLTGIYRRIAAASAHAV